MVSSTLIALESRESMRRYRRYAAYAATSENSKTCSLFSLFLLPPSLLPSFISHSSPPPLSFPLSLLPSSHPPPSLPCLRGRILGTGRWRMLSLACTSSSSRLGSPRTCRSDPPDQTTTGLLLPLLPRINSSCSIPLSHPSLSPSFPPFLPPSDVGALWQK